MAQSPGWFRVDLLGIGSLGQTLHGQHDEFADSCLKHEAMPPDTDQPAQICSCACVLAAQLADGVWGAPGSAGSHNTPTGRSLVCLHAGCRTYGCWERHTRVLRLAMPSSSAGPELPGRRV